MKIKYKKNILVFVFLVIFLSLGLFVFNFIFKKVSTIKNALAVTASGITIKNPYQGGGNWYLGQLHDHSTGTGGADTPAAVEAAYYDAGYNFLMISDKNVITANPNNSSSGKDIAVVIPGEEMSDAGGGHMGAINNTTTTVTTSDQEIINEIINKGGIVSMNHPDYDPTWLNSELSSASRYSLVEIMNGNVKNVLGGDGDARVKWDTLLTNYREVWGIGVDDMYNVGGLGFNTYAVRVQTSSATPTSEDIIRSLSMGDFYTTEGSNGPQISSVAVSSNVITITMPDIASNYNVVWIGKNGSTLETDSGVNISASYTTIGGEIYVRAEVTRVSDSKMAFSNPLFIMQTSDNISTNATASCSAGDAVDPCSNVNNGASTFWSADANPSQWFKLDFSQNTSFDAVEINYYSGDSRRFDYKIEGSTDDTNYIEIVPETWDNNLISVAHMFNTVSYRYLKITITALSNTGGSGNAVVEEIYVHQKSQALEVSTTGAAPNYDTITIQTPATFKMVFDKTKGGVIDEYYDKQGTNASTNISNSTYGIIDWLLNDGTTRRQNEETAANLTLEENTSTRMIIQATGQIGNLAGWDYTIRYTIYPLGIIYIDFTFTNNIGSSKSWSFWYPAFYNVITGWTSIGDNSNNTAPAPGTDNWFGSYYSGVNNFTSFVSMYYSSNFDVYSNFLTSASFSGYRDATTPSLSSGSSANNIWAFLHRPQGIDTEAEIDPYVNDYRNPDPLNSGTYSGSIVTGTIIGDGYNEKEGIYQLTALSNIAEIKFDDDRGINGRNYTFYNPAIEIQGWTDTGNVVVEKSADNGSSWSTLINGVNYNITTESEEASVGTNVRIFQYIGNVSGSGSAATRFRFSLPNNTPSASASNISGADDPVYAGTEYSITAVYSDSDGYDDLANLYLKIDHDTATDIEMHFPESGATGSGNVTVDGGSGYLIGTPTYSYISSGNNITATITFTLDWDYTESSLIEYSVKSIDDQLASSDYDSTNIDVRYENDLTFSGTLTASGSVQGSLSSGVWVKGGEIISWSGLTVVYEGSAISPPNSSFDIQITDDDTGSWTQSSGASLSLSSTSDSTTDASDIHNIDIVNIPAGGSDISSSTWTLKVDADAPTNVGLNTPSNNATAIATNITLVSLTASDGLGFGSGMSSIPYYVEIATDTSFTVNLQNSGWDADGSWQPSALQVGTIYYWRVKSKDAVGNESVSAGHTSNVSGYGVFTTLYPTPADPTLSSTSHPSETTYYNNSTPIIITSAGVPTPNHYHYLINQNANSSIAQIEAGASDTDGSFTVSPGIITSEGNWYVHIVAHNLDHNASGNKDTYTILYDTSAPTNTALNFGVIAATSIEIKTSGAADTLAGLHSAPYYFSRDNEEVNSGWQSSVSWVDSGLLVNTKYSYKIKSRDNISIPNISNYTASQARYTLIPTPANLVGITSETALTLSADSFPNDSSGSSGYYFVNTITNNNSGWRQVNFWKDTGLSCGTSYVYKSKYRNGDGIETSTIEKVFTTSKCPASTESGEEEPEEDSIPAPSIVLSFPDAIQENHQDRFNIIDAQPSEDNEEKIIEEEEKKSNISQNDITFQELNFKKKSLEEDQQMISTKIEEVRQGLRKSLKSFSQYFKDAIEILKEIPRSFIDSVKNLTMNPLSFLKETTLTLKDGLIDFGETAKDLTFNATKLVFLSVKKADRNIREVFVNLFKKREESVPVLVERPLQSFPEVQKDKVTFKTFYGDILIPQKQNVVLTLPVLNLKSFVKPKTQAKTIVTEVYANKLSKNDFREFNYFLGFPFILGVQASEVIQFNNENEIMVSRYVYQDQNQDEIWEAQINSPSISGEYNLRTIIEYETEENQIIENDMVVKANGYVHRLSPDKEEIRISDATVEVFWQNNNNWLIWPAKIYGQTNPQVTDKTGEYAFVLPNGKYYVKINKKGYIPWQSEEFTVEEGQFLAKAVELELQ